MLSLIINNMVNFLKNNIYKLVTLLILVVCFFLLKTKVVGAEEMEEGFTAFNIIFGYTDPLYNLELLQFSFVGFIGFALMMVAILLIVFSLLNPTLNANKAIGVLIIASALIMFMLPQFMVFVKEYSSIKDYMIQKPTLYISCILQVISGIVIIIEKYKISL